MGNPPDDTLNRYGPGRITRRKLFGDAASLMGAMAAGAALAPLASRAEAAGAPQKVRVIVFEKPPAVVAAQYKGFLAREGLDVDWTITRGSAEQMRGLLAGQWDIAQTAADNVMAYVDRENADAFIFLVSSLGLDQNLVVQPDIQAFGDLRGKTLGVDAVDTGFAFVLRKMLADAGLAPADYQFAPIGATQQRLNAMVAKRIAGCLLSARLTSTVQQKGFRILERGNQAFPLYPSSLTTATTRRWARAHEAAVAGYARAIWAATAWVADPANKEEAIGLIARGQSVDPEAARRLYEIDAEYRTKANPPLAQVAAALEIVRGLRREMTGTGRDLSAYFDDRYMRPLGHAGP
jgi:ABC-type nitrate/sulfonate/bicarbonate transport system substrate-binding protein